MREACTEAVHASFNVRACVQDHVEDGEFYGDLWARGDFRFCRI